MKKYAVYIGATGGPVRIERIVAEGTPLSEVFVGRSVEPVPSLSDAFDNFMRPGRPPDIAFGLSGETGYRMDLSSPIESGDSWQLAVLVAFGLARQGRLATAGETPDALLWLTGRVDADLRVQPVSHVEAKLRDSQHLHQTAGKPVTFIIPNDGSELPDDRDVMPVRDVRELFAGIGLETRPGKSARNVLARMPFSMKVVSAMLVAFLAWFAWQMSQRGDEMAVRQMATSQPTRSGELAPQISVAVLRPPSGGNCAAVHFGSVRGVLEATVVRDGAVSLSHDRAICGLAFTISARARGGAATTFADFRGDSPAELIGQPGESSAPVAFADRHEWTVLLPALIRDRMEIAVFAAAAEGNATEASSLKVGIGQ